ncbi:putative UDP-N-acetylglucosamine--peptide N-acetylglucosaminyltransferase SPINDLY [Camellia lanceoleosa]|uniref:UDP-N-acetylglucosamine--peptide N-acetylglucosaminyltransferase SPINDLY n=1 Tax=Camellia lanceoleosa TaxID=1840588 RepID=A0ACC0FIJ5_9ERIC|nr:putative UDP-N-acetylglucosamine--peptide N-acetylglucosaminyltransferase SPINDLY [Camellia lanceoleosa]
MIEKAIVANPKYAEAYNNLGLFVSLSHPVVIMFLACCYLLFLLTW